jgi:hypothetical protein
MKKKIGWQKYEDALEDQLHCPFINDLVEKIQAQEQAMIQELLDTGDYPDFLDTPDGTDVSPAVSSVAISKEMIEEASVIANFDCWVGHTNFDITPSIKVVLEKTAGIELLKVQSRYRFFIGVGRMFRFGEVRKDIEEKFLI